MSTVRYTFPVDATNAIRDQLNAYPGSRIQFIERQSATEKYPTGYLKVIPASPVTDGGDPPEINNSHRCPPNTDCPE